jgi:5'-3' exoribonuclease 1
MGIKHFFMWFKNHFSEYTHKLPKGTTLEDIDVSVDNFMIDMNGIFHNSAQKIHEYGNFKQPPRLMKKKTQPKGIQLQLKLFQDVCETIDHLYTLVKPNKRLILCVDGPAPLSKQNQQRQRRFRSAMESSTGEGGFDSNCITPGTKFMDYLTKYIDWFIRKKISDDPLWRNIEVVFSNEKAPGEGEHKIINYIRYYGNKNETYCINGMDADLIMLALGTHMPNFYILRDETYDPTIDYFCIDIGKVHEELIDIMRWECPKFTFIPDSTVEDFIFLCFMVGNDFLPHIPSIEIIESGIELILDIYKKVCSEYGHITHNHLGRVQFIPKALEIFLQIIGQYEKENLQQKLKKKASFFPDPIMEKCSTQNENGKWYIDIDKYRTQYWEASFPVDCCPEKICHEYLEGMQWVLSYYTRGVPNWRWHFCYHYAPPASILASHLSTFKFPKYCPTIPSTPYQQLLCVLPPKSAQLIPHPLCTLLTDPNSLLKDQCPDKFEIDLAGKRKEWEGIVLLPIVDFELVRKCYFNLISKVKQTDLKCNTGGCSFLYQYIPELSYSFKSYYGEIDNCKTKTKVLDL